MATITHTKKRKTNVTHNKKRKTCSCCESMKYEKYLLKIWHPLLRKESWTCDECVNYYGTRVEILQENSDCS